MKFLGVTVDNERRIGNTSLDFNPMLSRLCIEEIDSTVQGLPQIVMDSVEFRRSREIEKTLNRCFHPSDLVKNKSDFTLVKVRPRGLPNGMLQKQLYRGQRIANLVRHTCGQFADRGQTFRLKDFAAGRVKFSTDFSHSLGEVLGLLLDVLPTGTHAPGALVEHVADQVVTGQFRGFPSHLDDRRAVMAEYQVPELVGQRPVHRRQAGLDQELVVVGELTPLT